MAKIFTHQGRQFRRDEDGTLWFKIVGLLGEADILTRWHRVSRWSVYWLPADSN